MKIVILVGLFLLILIEYSMCVISHDADERAERMYKEWRRENEGSDSEADV